MDNASAKHLTVQAKGRSILQVPRVSRFIDLLVAGDHKFEEAAKEAGLRLKRARLIMSDPAIRRHYFQQCEVVTESERGRNIRLRRKVRDRGMDDAAPAALAKVALEAARQLDGDESSTGITINGGNNVLAGYVVVIEGEVEGPRAITNRSADGAKSLTINGDVTDVDG